jgi:hypothetical protein
MAYGNNLEIELDDVLAGPTAAKKPRFDPEPRRGGVVTRPLADRRAQGYTANINPVIFDAGLDAVPDNIYEALGKAGMNELDRLLTESEMTYPVWHDMMTETVATESVAAARSVLTTSDMPVFWAARIANLFQPQTIERAQTNEK